jgi:hypothetical protein
VNEYFICLCCAQVVQGFNASQQSICCERKEMVPVEESRMRITIRQAVADLFDSWAEQDKEGIDTQSSAEKYCQLLAHEVKSFYPDYEVEWELTELTPSVAIVCEGTCHPVEEGEEIAQWSADLYASARWVVYEDSAIDTEEYEPDEEL